MPPITSNNPAAKPTGKDETHTRKTSSAAARTTQEPAVKCPRCDSPNTKFCYYNNYSLTQPRHFCKTCRRYWTKGGALRNVPIGGGCRKNKKLKSSQRLSGDSKDSSSSSDVGGGLKFFQGLSPAMDFQLGGINNTPPSNIFNQYSSFGDLSVNPNFNLESSGINSTPLMGFGFPLSSSSLKQGQTFNNNTQLGFQEMGSMNVHSNLASSIEDLHWKLQQQRLSTLFGDQDNQKENSNIPSGNIEVPLIQKPQPILFQNLENSKPDQSCLIGTSRKDGGNGNLSTELFFSNSYAAVGPTPATSSSNNLNDNSSNWSGMQAWTELAQYSSLP